jgi:methionyl aminopeptidase
MSHLNVLILGPQGSGKGTQAKRVAATYGIPHVATGDMIREMKELDTPLGHELKEVYDRGDLVSDELMVRLIRDRLSRGDTLPGFILDGFPRTMPQAEALDELLREVGRRLDVVLEIQVPDRGVLLERMLKRAAEESRSDDTPEAFQRRLELYDRETAPLVEYYRTAQGNVVGLAGEHLEPGVSMLELDRIAEEHVLAQGGVPTSKGYRGFPAALCISPNSMVVHGIPTDYRAREGDLISVDLGVTLDGLVADSAVTYGVGEIEPESQRLLDVCQDALAAGIAEARVGNHLTDISHAIQTVVEDAGFSVVRSLVGHGVGRSYHEDPQIPNYGAPGRGPVLQEGMTLAIEPMITAGGPDVYVHDDDWSISSVDESLAAHFEHTVAVTADGPRILTTAKATLLR